MFENDADVGQRELNLKLTDRVNMRMVGVPEKAFGRWALKLIEKGYKVRASHALTDEPRCSL
jgi:DNA mismatch repair protein MSH6